MINSKNTNKNSFIYFLLITLIFISFYVITLNYIISSLDILDFIKNSPDKETFKKISEKLKNESFFSIIKNGGTIINIQFDILSRYINYQITQIVILYFSIISIGFCLRKYLNMSEYIVYIIFFIPSFIYLVALNLKDFYVFYVLATSFLTFFIFYQEKNKFNIKKYFFLFIIIFFNTYILYFSKPYIFYLLIPITFIFYFLKNSLSLIKKK